MDRASGSLVAAGFVMIIFGLIVDSPFLVIGALFAFVLGGALMLVEVRRRIK